VNQLWPRLGSAAALVDYEEIVNSRHSRKEIATAHPQQTFAATGGSRVNSQTIANLASAVEAVAASHGYPGTATSHMRTAFDRAAAETLYGYMKITAFEASQPGIWTFLAVVVMPNITQWRFGTDTLERWIASDLTRHMFARLWWQAFTFGVPASDGSTNFDLLRELSEGDLNQLTERKSIGGNHRLARVVAAELIASSGNRRQLVRELAPKLRRLVPFVDFSAVSDDDLRELVHALTPPS
jgi:uncharacterized protein DUF6339